jgi:hypothetical protein
MIEAAVQMDECFFELNHLANHERAFSAEINILELEGSFSHNEKLRSWKKLVPFLKKLQQILRDKEYPEMRTYSAEKLHIELANKKFDLSSRRKIVEGLRNGKTVDEIIKSMMIQILELREKQISLPLAEQKKILVKDNFPANNNWCEILRVTDCDHCTSFRYFFIFSFSLE